MNGDLIVGIDVGTTRVKAAVFARDGSIRDYFSGGYETKNPGAGIVEQDAHEWTRLVSKALQSFSRHAKDVAAVGLCSQVNTHVFCDADGQPLAPAIVWQDTRTRDIATKLDARVSHQERMAWWGAPMPIDASHALSRMQWMAQTHPDIWARTGHVLLPKDFCIAHLTGRVVTDGLANIGLTGPDLAYAENALALVDGAYDRMAPLADVVSIIGEVAYGPFKGTPVANGTMDGWTGILGTTGARPGATGYLSGTSEIPGINSMTVNPTPGIIVFAPCGPVRLHAAPTQSGGASLMWLCGLLSKSPEMVMKMAEAAEPKDTPLFLPHMQGERAPLWNAGLRGVFAGIGKNTGPNEMARAVLEGVAYSVRHATHALEASTGTRSETIIGGGGGFRSDVWNQIRANVLGRRIERVSAQDPGALGAAGIAACAIGMSDSLQGAFDGMLQTDATYDPDTAAHQWHEERFALYKQAIDANAEVNAAWSAPA